MPNILKAEQSPSTASLIADIIVDAQKLVRQELDLAKAEIKQELVAGKAALLTFGTASSFRTIAFLHVSLAVVFLLFELFGLPLWLCFLITAIVLGVIALVLQKKARAKIDTINLIPRKALESVKENVQWIKNQV